MIFRKKEEDVVTIRKFPLFVSEGAEDRYIEISKAVATCKGLDALRFARTQRDDKTSNFLCFGKKDAVAAFEDLIACEDIQNYIKPLVQPVRSEPPSDLTPKREAHFG